MGGLIQTKGTQRLANLFNRRFIDLDATRKWLDGGGKKVPDVFRTTPKLLAISDAFIAQNANAAAAANWPPDMNDLLYPSATLKVDTIPSSTQLTFKLPGRKPDAIVDTSAVSCIEPGKKAKAIKKNTKVSGAPVVAGGVLTVTLSNAATTDLAIGDRVSFALGKHERLVRRWRWYLEKDLKPESNDAIRLAICAALDDDDFKIICFQTVEDMQKVIVTPRSILDPNDDEFSDDMEMDILLMTQSTTAPDKLEPQ